MVILRSSVAGTMESSDCMVTVSRGSGVEIIVNSLVYQQFGESIKNTVKEVIEDLGVKDIKVEINDTGAIDFVIRARVETAILRACTGI